MAEATPSAAASAREGAVEGPAADPTVGTLLPARSTARNVALAAAAVLVLVGAWWSPALLRPTIAPWNGGVWGVTPVDRSIVATSTVWRTESPGITVVRVRDVPGARVAGAWLTNGPEGPGGPGPTEKVGEYVASLGAEPLPAGLAGNSGRQLIVAWEITDCTLLREDVGPTLELRSAVGAPGTVQLDPMLGPAYDLTLLEEQGICPEGTDPTPY